MYHPLETLGIPREALMAVRDRRDLDIIWQRVENGRMSPGEAQEAIRATIRYSKTKDTVAKCANEAEEMRRWAQMMRGTMEAPAWYEARRMSTPEPAIQNTKEQLQEAKEVIEKQNAILENIKKEPLILYVIERLTKDKKHAYIKKQDTELRIESCPDLEVGDEVLLHPKSMQIVERLGRPPLEVSRFCPDAVPNVKWDDIGGLEQAKADMIEAIEMPHKYKDLFKFYNKRPIKGLLLSGPPGCGKTMLGKAAANCLATIYGKENARTGFLYVKGPEILNMYVGATEQTIRELFQDANRHHEEHGYPAIIFIDEADAVLATRGERNVGIGNTIVPAFLTEMDGLEGSSAIVIIATNRPDVLDPAIVRDGRIDRKVEVTRPTIDNARDIIGKNIIKFPVAKEHTHEELAEIMVSEIYSDTRFVKRDLLLREIVNGALLSGCVDLAVSNAIHRDLLGKNPTGIMPDDVMAAVNRTQHQNGSVMHDINQAA